MQAQPFKGRLALTMPINGTEQALEAKKTKYRPAHSIKAPAVKTAVISRRTQGQTKAQIARELGIATNTVNGIIEESGLDKILSDQGLESAKLIPEALRVAHVRLAKDSESMAIKVLENTIWPLNDRLTGNKRMAGDVTLNQTLQVLLSNETAKDEKLNSPVLNVIPNTPEDK